MSGLRGKVVVLTGASSGLGREAAVQFARRGCIVFLAARREDALEETARLCRDEGGMAVPIVTDITVEADVERLAKAALDHSGRIDVWVSNAGVTLFAPLEEGPFEEHRRVIETNVFGTMLCARVVVPIFRRQKQGVLINVGSVLSKVGQPFVPAYVVSKFGIHGLSEALRTQVADLPNVHVCTLFPYAIDTPHFEAGANRVGREARPIPPTQPPEKVAAAIVSLAERPRRELYVPRYVQLGLMLHALMPRRVERLIRDVVSEWHFTDAVEPAKDGNLYTPGDERAEVHGRPPKGSTPALAVWIARHLAKSTMAPSPEEDTPPTPNAAKVREEEPA